MKIALVHSFYSSSQPSGENSAVMDQLAALERHGFEVRLISRRTDDFSGPGHILRAASTAAGFGGPDPSAELEAFAPDIVHVHNLFPNWGSSWLKHWGERAVSTLHNFRPVCANATLWRDGSKCTECITHGSVRSIIHGCYRDSKIASIPLAVSTRSAGKYSALIHETAASIVLNSEACTFYRSIFPDSDFTVLPNFGPAPTKSRLKNLPEPSFIYAGRLVAEKGVRDLLENWPADVVLHIYGSGDLVEYVENVASRKANVYFHGAQPRETVLNALISATALVLPSQWPEGIPTIALEALGSGTPVMVSATVSAAETIIADGAGVILDFTSPASLLSAIRKVSESGLEMRDAAYGRYQQSFSSVAWLSAIVPLYERIASAST
ncbi:glycosyltransferase family 4 protein [Rhodococcus cerastii]|uniref:Glycosyltransferase family 4 protein n=1 Tax=Rhodococcus cerastii TaxID=908616 RepID=A0ABU4D406_9NOCA|nr:glycosyltransferase family 4 protein [Rhodococcus cerastii]MDV6304443.1 glycosyltransferase family 4 protein [Rhodococcus cerastii]